MRAVVLPAALASYPAVKFYLLRATPPDGASAFTGFFTNHYLIFWACDQYVSFYIDFLNWIYENLFS